MLAKEALSIQVTRVDVPNSHIDRLRVSALPTGAGAFSPALPAPLLNLCLKKLGLLSQRRYNAFCHPE